MWEAIEAISSNRHKYYSSDGGHLSATEPAPTNMDCINFALTQ